MDDAADPFADFDTIATEADLEAVIGTPPAKVVDKVLDRLDDICRDFIARSPFCLIATANEDGHIDVSPKGDPAGFARVLDDNRIAIPDRPGNRRADSFRNLIGNPKIGILFLIPGKAETLRIRGQARIARDAALRESMAVDGKTPALALVVHVAEAFMHCPKCVIRSRLWDPDSWGDSADMPDIGRTMIRHAGIDMTPDELFAEAEAEGLTRLY